MLRLQDIMTRDVLTVDPELSIRDAMELLATRHVGGAPVASGHHVLGVVSMTDLVAFAASLPGVPSERPVEAAWDEDESESPAERDGEPEAMFFTELWSDAGADVVERFNAVGGPEWNVLEEHTVSEAMTRPVRSMPPAMDVMKAAGIMSEEGIHRVLVMEGDRLLGIVSLTDIARAAAAHKLTSRTYVFGRGRAFDDRGAADET
jgi:CBS domain-containing protein